MRKIAITGVLWAIFSGGVAFAIELHHIHGLALDPADPRILYVATHTGLARWEEGKGWSLLGEERPDLMGFRVHPKDRRLMVASGHPPPAPSRANPVGVVVSRDGGRSWQSLALEGKADLHAMALSPADGNTLYGWSVGPEIGLFRLTLNDGRWTRVAARGLDNVFALAAHPREVNHLVAGTRAGLLASRDGGKSWGLLGFSGVSVTAVEFHPSDPLRLYAYAARSDLGLIESRDGGKAWSSTGFVLGPKDAVAVLALHPANPGALFFATFYGDLYYSPDGGRQRRVLVKSGRPAE